ncbi:MAG: hypothetical protein K8U57_08395 [Planctomycetes bacterium]|nr:hypothetical protein [Planctomycetota bacterium]
MKSSFGIAGLATLALAVAAIPAAAVDQKAAVQNLVPFPHEPPSPLPDLSATAIGAVVEANGGTLPMTGAGLTTALAKLGSVVQLSFPFSAVALDSGLSHPRVVLTLRMSQTVEPIPFTPVGGWGSGSSRGQQLASTSTPNCKLMDSRIPTPGPMARNLEGRLFLAANMDAGVPGESPHVKNVEFISWNSKRMKFDFGVIDQMGTAPRIKFLDGVRCFSCHKNHGPIMGVGPWSNSIHNDMVRSANNGQFPTADPVKGVDGMQLLSSNAPEVEEAVRAGANMLRNREVIRALPKTGVGRKSLQSMLVAIASPGSLTELDSHIRRDMNHGDLIKFIGDSVAIQKATPSGFLTDFSPAGSIGKLNGNRIAWGGSSLSVTQYDAQRAAGQPGVPTEHLPSNPRAFLRPPVNVSAHPGDHLSSAKLARTMGITEGDRVFLDKTFRDAALFIAKPQVTATSLAKQVFSSPAFEDVIAGSYLPDRDEFKDRVVSALEDITQKSTQRSWGTGDRKTYTSIPKIERGSEEKEIEVIPTTACLRCHDVRPTGRQPVGFSPIPLLAFDPFDKTGRETWLKTAERKQKVDVLSRFMKRLATDKDMPPEDSVEAQLFREKDPVAFDNLKTWLEAELKKAKGN